jgi:predicted RecA/RadA family phage recombinase
MAKEAVEIQKGGVIEYTLSSDVNVGDVVPLGTEMVGIAVNAGLTGEEITLELEKVWTIKAKDTDVIVVGNQLYFDVANREVTLMGTDNVKAGKAMTSKAAVAGTVNVKINA